MHISSMYSFGAHCCFVHHLTVEKSKPVLPTMARSDPLLASPDKSLILSHLLYKRQRSRTIFILSPSLETLKLEL